MKYIEGRIEIDLYSAENKDNRVEIKSSRPLQAVKIMIGKKPEDALQVIPLLYNICGLAQARTALLALQQCRFIEINPAMESAREILLLVETAREHLFRILVDWPGLFAVDIPVSDIKIVKPPLSGQQTREFSAKLFKNGDAFSFKSKLQPDLPGLKNLVDNLRQELRDRVFETDPDGWLAMDDLEGLYRWADDCQGIAGQSIKIICDQNWQAEGASACSHLPRLDGKELLARLNADNADEFIARPEWRGTPQETTPLSRNLKHPLIQSLEKQYANGLITRWMARLVELARIPRQIEDWLVKLEQANNQTLTQPMLNTGLAQVEAARGRLIHRSQLKHDKIAQYQIIAPTEWNFHPEGLVANSLARLSAKDPAQLEQLARLVINTIDPCVGYELRIHTGGKNA